MKAVYCPIETSLNFQQANKLIKELKPGCLIIPENYSQPPSIVPHKTDLIIDPIPDKPVITFKKGDVLKLPLKRRKNRVYLTPDIAQTIVPCEVQEANLSTITGILQVKDNLHDISAYDNQDINDRKQNVAPTRETILKNTKYEWGTLDVENFIKKLNQDGITDIKVEHTDSGLSTITLPNENTVIKIENKSSHIICGGKQSLRLKLRDLLLQCVQNF